MTTTIEDHPLGMEGLELGLAKMSVAILVGMRNPRVIEWTRKTIHDAGLPRGASPAAQASALFGGQKLEMTFVQDPICTELIMSAESLLCLPGAPYCIRGGDCDDQIVVLGSALMSAGIPVRLLVRHYPGPRTDLHVMLQYDADLAKRGDWRCFDPSVESGQCSGGHDWQLVAEVTDMAQELPGQLMTMGRPPAAASARMGDPPAQTLTPQQQAAWLGMLQRGKDDLDASRARLRAATAQLDQVRADLGLPLADPPPPPESPGSVSTSPLQTYAATHVWSADAQNAQAKVLQAADLISAMCADGLSGARALYWNSGDLFISAKAGDPYGVLVVDGAPQFVDITNDQPTGRMGIAPIVIGIAIVAVSLAAVYAVTKVMDYLSQAHRDDAMQHVADSQQALVTAGKQTPEQAAQFMKAAADLASAPPPNAAPSQGFPWWQLLAGVAAGIAVGAIGANVADRFVSGLTFQRA